MAKLILLLNSKVPDRYMVISAIQSRQKGPNSFPLFLSRSGLRKRLFNFPNPTRQCL